MKTHFLNIILITTALFATVAARCQTPIGMTSDQLTEVYGNESSREVNRADRRYCQVYYGTNPTTGAGRIMICAYMLDDVCHEITYLLVKPGEVFGDGEFKRYLDAYSIKSGNQWVFHENSAAVKESDKKYGKKSYGWWTLEKSASMPYRLHASQSEGNYLGIEDVDFRVPKQPDYDTATLPVVVTPQAVQRAKTLAEWVSVVKSDARFSTLQASLGKPDGKEESQDNIQRYTTYRWWSKVDVGTTHTEDLKVKTVIAHGQSVIVGLENPSSGEEIEFPWSDATIWGRN